MDYSPTLSQRLKSKLKRLAKRALNAARVGIVPVSTQLDRGTIARVYLKGSGIEIGALHNPLQVPRQAQVRYVDRMSVADLRKQYAELADVDLVKVDILDDGEQLATISNSTQDFVIANHFIEHCQNPILAIKNMVRVLKPGGILYLGIPDKRYTFDLHRPVTEIEHLLQDYREGPEWSKENHFKEWVRFVCFNDAHGSQGNTDVRITTESDRLMKMDYSIHFHTWTQTEILELLVTFKKVLNLKFEVELFLKNKDEMILILSKGH